MNGNWLIDEIQPLKEIDTFESNRRLRGGGRAVVKDRESIHNLAVFLKPLIIHDTKKWFGEAQIRLDALIVHGGDKYRSLHTLYMPKTLRFPRVTDGDDLATGENGLLIFYGKPRHFLGLYLTVSRDRKDSEDLSKLLAVGLESGDVQSALQPLLTVAMGTPDVAAVQAGLVAAAKLGEIAYEFLSRITGGTIGLYRTSWLQYRDRFGLGKHPQEGTFKEKDLSFAYEIVPDIAADPNPGRPAGK